MAQKDQHKIVSLNFRDSFPIHVGIKSQAIKHHKEMKIRRIAFHWQILIAIVLSILIATVIKMTGSQNAAFTIKLLDIFHFFGQLFMNALKMIIVPVIISSIVYGILSIGNTHGMGRLAAKTIAFYALTSALAIVIGLVFVNVIQPGTVDAETASAIVGQKQDVSGFLEKVEGKTTSVLSNLFLRMVPTNIFEVTTRNNQLLGIIVVSLFIGFFLNKLPSNLRTVQVDFWNGIHQMMIMFTHFIIRFTPLGVLALITPIFTRTGLELAKPLFWFVACVLLGLATHFFVAMWLILRYMARIKPGKHYKAMIPALLTAFSTASSTATLPLTMQCVEEKGNISSRVSSFTLPIGATVNMDGTALYEAIVVLFIAQFYSVTSGFVIDLGMQITVAIMALLTSIGVAGIPSASLVAIALILSAVGLPLEAIGLVLVVDRVLDMLRTAVNVFGDSVGAAVIARSEGEDIYNN